MPDAQRLADVLWAATCHDPEPSPDGPPVRTAWRTRVYGPVAQRCRARIQSHRDPGAWLSLKCALQLASGDGWERRSRRYEGIEGGEVTELEYQRLRGRDVELPVLLVGGFPRSGTTTLQTVVRAAFRSHIPEIETVEERFSLWDYPKHTSSVFGEAARLNGSTVIGLCTVRPFLDCAASLVVGRGGAQHVDVRREVELWESWLPVYELPACRVIPFEVLIEMEPAELAQTIGGLTGVVPDPGAHLGHSYAALMRSIGKGDPDNPLQSNLPTRSRAGALAEARAWVASQLGERECARLEAAYSSIPFSLLPTHADWDEVSA